MASALGVGVRPPEAVHALDQVLERAKLGNEEAFRVLVNALSPTVTRRLMRGLCRDEDAASAVLQDVWLAAWGRMARFTSQDHLVRWIQRVATNKAISTLRRARREKRAIGVVAEGCKVMYSRPGEGTRLEDDDGDADRVWDAIRRLPGPYRSVAVLLYRHGRTVSQGACLLELSMPAMKMRMHRMRRLLRDSVCVGASVTSGDTPMEKKGNVRNKRRRFYALEQPRSFQSSVSTARRNFKRARR